MCWNFELAQILGRGGWLMIEFKYMNRFNQSYLYNEISIYSLYTETHWTFLVGEHIDVPGG